MKKKAAKLCSLALVILMLLSTLPACGGVGKSKGSKNQNKITDQKDKKDSKKKDKKDKKKDDKKDKKDKDDKKDDKKDVDDEDLDDDEDDTDSDRPTVDLDYNVRYEEFPCEITGFNADKIEVKFLVEDDKKQNDTTIFLIMKNNGDKKVKISGSYSYKDNYGELKEKDRLGILIADPGTELIYSNIFDEMIYDDLNFKLEIEDHSDGNYADLSKYMEAEFQEKSNGLHCILKNTSDSHAHTRGVQIFKKDGKIVCVRGCAFNNQGQVDGGGELISLTYWDVIPHYDTVEAHFQAYQKQD